MRKKYWGSTEEEQNIAINAEPLTHHLTMADILNTAGSIKSFDNTIHFYSDVTLNSCAEVNRLLREIDCRLCQSAVVINNPTYTPIIHLRINSFGGDLLAGLSTVDTIRGLKSKVWTYVEGSCASAATLMTVAGAKRFIGKNSLMLIHQLSSFACGTFEHLKDEQENNVKLMEIIKSIYKQYTKFPMKELEAILKRDIWLDSASCLKYGLVDEIL
jgi:ATP-dependent protease ClpP protease subunit